MTRKTAFLSGGLGSSLIIRMAIINVAKRLKLKVRKFWGLIRTFVEVTGEKLLGKLLSLNKAKSDSTRGNFLKCFVDEIIPTKMSAMNSYFDSKSQYF